jgi:hypothetical protein
MEWVASTLHTTAEHGVSSITTADARTPAASSRLNWRPRRFKWTRPFRRRTKSGFCACAITFQTQSTNYRSPTMLHNFFGLSRYHLSTVQINPFRQSPSHSATERQSFRFSVKICSRSALAGGSEKVPPPKPDPSVGRPASLIQNKTPIQYITPVLWGNDAPRTQSGRCVLALCYDKIKSSPYQRIVSPENALLQGRRQAEEGTGQMWANMTDRWG